MAEHWCETFGEHRGRQLHFKTFNLYHADYWITKPATNGYGGHGCSLVEVMAVQIQRPHWFVSHAWIEPCLERHFLESESHCVWCFDLKINTSPARHHVSGHSHGLWDTQRHERLVSISVKVSEEEGLTAMQKDDVDTRLQFVTCCDVSL